MCAAAMSTERKMLEDSVSIELLHISSIKSPKPARTTSSPRHTRRMSSLQPDGPPEAPWAPVLTMRGRALVSTTMGGVSAGMTGMGELLCVKHSSKEAITSGVMSAIPALVRDCRPLAKWPRRARPTARRAWPAKPSGLGQGRARREEGEERRKHRAGGDARLA